MIYEGNNFKECKAIASIMTQNDSDYKESMKTCNSLLFQAQHQQSLPPQWRGMDNDSRQHGEQMQKKKLTDHHADHLIANLAGIALKNSVRFFDH